MIKGFTIFKNFVKPFVNLIKRFVKKIFGQNLNWVQLFYVCKDLF